jgi:hypothetical protein
MGQDRYLQRRTWSRKTYTKYRPDWDHDHCSFCGAKFMETGTPDTMHEGYSTQEDYYWVCSTCFEDFKEMFEWTAQDERGPHSPI